MLGDSLICDVMEKGESGAGLWVKRSTATGYQYYVRAVESHGWTREGQAELDVGCEFDTINYNFVVKNKGNKP
jgi:hypothetical protein